MKPIERVVILKKNINEFLEESNLIKKNSLDLVLSDMAPKADIDLQIKINRFSRKSNFICPKLFVI